MSIVLGSLKTCSKPFLRTKLIASDVYSFVNTFFANSAIALFTSGSFIVSFANSANSKITYSSFTVATRTSIILSWTSFSFIVFIVRSIPRSSSLFKTRGSSSEFNSIFIVICLTSGSLIAFSRNSIKVCKTSWSSKD